MSADDVPDYRKDPPPHVFRAFKNRLEAMRLVDGYVWLPTFESIRKSDLARHSDPKEGTASWAVPHVRPGDPHHKEVTDGIKATGLAIGDLSSVSFRDITITNSCHGYLVCTTELHDYAGFGDHRVKIENVNEFARAITQALANHYREKWGGDWSRLIYDRVGTGISPPSPAFVGTPGNHVERELRFAFQPIPNRIVQPVELCVPAVRHLCSICPSV